ncbi:MAG TPA: hypothetical protein VF789_23370 [Thermoanaerobaculia bacterium]
MNRTVFSILILTALLASAMPADAKVKVCSNEVTPAATLLLPYFEVSLGPPTGITTVFSINNASMQPVLVKAEVWSDLGVGIFGFNIYLKGFDVQTINLRDILVNGALPQTGPALFPDCHGVLPPAPIPAGLRADYQKALTGQPSALLSGLCAGRRFTDNIARGYITFDTVNNCTVRNPRDPAYFTTDITDQNVLWGDFFFVDQAAGTAQGAPLVHIESDPLAPETSVAGEYTFYGAYIAWSGIDNREPLPTTFGVRYINGPVGATPTTTDLIVWRDPKVSQSEFTCPAVTGRPAWYPLGQERIEIGDENGNHYLMPRKAFPAVAQRVRVGRVPLPTRYPFGWMYLNLNHSRPANPNPPEDPQAAQAWVIGLEFAGSNTSAGWDAMHYDSACDALHGFPPIF